VYKNKPIGILGGMGPQASAHLYDLLIKMSCRFFCAKNNNDFPEILLDSIPVPDFISDKRRKKHALALLQERVRYFNKINLLCLSLACNTAHILFPDLQKISKAPFVSMIDEVVAQVNIGKIKVIGLLATPSTIEYALYQKALIKREIRTIVPNYTEQSIVEKIIRNVLVGKVLKSDSKKLYIIADSLKRRGATGILLGCTELPLVFPKKYSLPVYDSVEILAMALLQKYYKQNTI
jgi:aspartate racemase